MGHIDEAQLNDYLDELLSAEDSRTVEAHLGDCAECADYLGELRILVGQMGELPMEAESGRDLWSGIHARIDGKDADVLEMPTGRGFSTARRVSMSWGQLLAASIVLASVSGGFVWAALQTQPSAVTGTGFVSPVVAVQTATTRYDEAIVELEQLIAQGSDILSAETLQALEQSLLVIDRAIREAQGALADDPNSGLLNRLLANHQQAKLRVLQRTVVAMQI